MTARSEGALGEGWTPTRVAKGGQPLKIESHSSQEESKSRLVSVVRGQICQVWDLTSVAR